MAKRIGIFVIAYNAVNKLDWTLDRIPKEVWDKVEEVFLFDDCSTDNTYFAAVGYKHVNAMDKLTLHRNPKNLRYGGNQKQRDDARIPSTFVSQEPTSFNSSIKWIKLSIKMRFSTFRHSCQALR